MIDCNTGALALPMTSWRYKCYDEYSINVDAISLIMITGPYIISRRKGNTSFLSLPILFQGYGVCAQI